MNKNKKIQYIVLLLGLLVIGIGFYLYTQNKPEIENDLVIQKESTDNKFECSLFKVRTGDEEGLKLLKDLYTTDGNGSMSKERLEAELGHFVIRVNDKKLPSEEKIDFLKSEKEREVILRVKIQPHVLDEDLNNPRHNPELIKDLYIQEGYLQGRYFGNSQDSEPCMFNTDQVDVYQYD